ncbi:MAG: NTP transferase domain-containing protein, partial [Candidatus Rokubacteria bacterium]|nr:NTP transferase domain-containing protein [Candidatus Rokubacteria bacterium]
MTGEPILQGGILAAGTGTRLRDAGWTVPKPMVPVAGAPLIESAIGHFVAAGIRSLVIIVNGEERHVVEWVRSRFPGLDLRFIVKTTGSSLESFREVTSAIGPRRALISTVDAWCPEPDFVHFVDAARRFPPDAVVLAV